jgi:HAMP domain.
MEGQDHVLLPIPSAVHRPGGRLGPLRDLGHTSDHRPHAAAGNEIRAELAAININDLSTRVPEPSGNGEIARLAGTINNTLQRLENAKE